MFAPALILVGSLVSVWMSLDFLRPVRSDNPFGL